MHFLLFRNKTVIDMDILEQSIWKQLVLASFMGVLEHGPCESDLPIYC